MAFVLYDEQRKKIGDIEDWSRRQDPPTYKTFLGKTALLTPANDECTFTSPKPVRRKAKLTIIEDGKIEFRIEVIREVGGTAVTAKITETKNLK